MKVRGDCEYLGRLIKRVRTPTLSSTTPHQFGLYTKVQLFAMSKGSHIGHASNTPHISATCRRHTFPLIIELAARVSICSDEFVFLVILKIQAKDVAPPPVEGIRTAILVLGLHLLMNQVVLRVPSLPRHHRSAGLQAMVEEYGDLFSRIPVPLPDVLQIVLGSSCCQVREDRAIISNPTSQRAILVTKHNQGTILEFVPKGEFIFSKDYSSPEFLYGFVLESYQLLL